MLGKCNHPKHVRKTSLDEELKKNQKGNRVKELEAT